MKEELESSASIPWFIDLEAADFDGHTAFASMSAEQRLDWLSHAARFVFAAREAVANAGLSAIAVCPASVSKSKVATAEASEVSDD